MALTPRQQRFVQEYLIDLNATAAYKRAGYKANDNVARVQSCRLLVRPNIKQAISAAQASLARQAEVKAANVLNEISHIAFSDIGDVLDFSGDELRLRSPRTITSAARRAIQSVKVRRAMERQGEESVPVEIIEYRLWPKLDALDKLGQHLGLWKELDLERILADIPEPTNSQLRAALGLALPSGNDPPRLTGDPGPELRALPAQPDSLQPGHPESAVVGEAAGDSPAAA